MKTSGEGEVFDYDLTFSCHSRAYLKIRTV